MKTITEYVVEEYDEKTKNTKSTTYDDYFSADEHRRFRLSESPDAEIVIRTVSKKLLLD